eukprot:TRINITY_DN67989_c2_g9_i3.p1 TRINITY_DN67989_c2_g9~~TRINITY_DN67989_c2_g9_i3.p1  ORF type:complete len:388 (+),score=46.86 TRINITY_DN67989_c2_g9_i3:45-1208(+)
MSNVVNTKCRFFVIRAPLCNFALSQRYKVWATQKYRQKNLQNAYNCATTVLLFSATHTKAFQGFCIMRSAPSPKVEHPPWETSTALSDCFKVEWICQADMSFEKVHGNLPRSTQHTTYYRDMMELKADLGVQICKILQTKKHQKTPGKNPASRSDGGEQPSANSPNKQSPGTPTKKKWRQQGDADEHPDQKIGKDGKHDRNKPDKSTKKNRSQPGNSNDAPKDIDYSALPEVQRFVTILRKKEHNTRWLCEEFTTLCRKHKINPEPELTITGPPMNSTVKCVQKGHVIAMVEKRKQIDGLRDVIAQSVTALFTEKLQQAQNALDELDLTTVSEEDVRRLRELTSVVSGLRTEFEDLRQVVKMEFVGIWEELRIIAKDFEDLGWQRQD